MVTFGNLSQTAAFIILLSAMGLTLTGLMRNDLRYIESGKRALAASAIFASLAAFSLFVLFMTDSFQVEYVAKYSDKALPFFYKATSFWAGQKGSLLFWAWVLSLYAALVVFNTRNEKHRKATPYIYLILAGILSFFFLLLTMVSNPFELLSYTPPDGQGLNPMLQNPGMIFHPPTLFLGYIGFTIPFAYAMAAMISGKLDPDWLRKTRRWNVLSWIFLTIGIILGGQWAYVELGWGGFWAWDPVENASFIPWLVATAFIHTAIIQERRNIMKVWNMSLIVLTFVLCIFGTYLVRSGVLQSVHDFGATGLGGYFLVFLVIVTMSAILLIAESYGELRTKHSLESFLSRESTFLFNNVILLAIAFATFFGTIFPLISELVTGNKLTVGEPFFNQVNTPLFLLLLLITGVCPLIGWRKSSPNNLKKNFLVPFAVTIIGTIVLLVAGIRGFYPLTAFALSIFVSTTIIKEFAGGAKARQKLTRESFVTAFPRMLWSLRRRYGGYIVHFGMVLMVVGITGSTAFKKEKETTLQRGESMTIGAYNLLYKDFKNYQDRNRNVYAAVLGVTKNGAVLDDIATERRYYINAKQPTTEVSLRSTLIEDLYLTMPMIGTNNEITIKAAVNPLLLWGWIGSCLMVLGGIMAIIPSRGRSKLS
jgi:cytochrome c-type biogenesis protein CcmF